VGWALPPIMLQVAVGADLLWRYRRLVVATLLPVLFYLSAMDALAIGFGTWTINPELTVNVYLGQLPLEEFIFFLLTNVLIVFGMTLALVLSSAISYIFTQRH
jgi:lycopene cyclase domain-containing protein